MPLFAEIGSSILLFGLVFGMSATVDIRHMQKQMGHFRALWIGPFMQFVILPMLGFISVKIFSLPSHVGITLLVITSSPGGSYSNWWCSIFNADLALSVTMTALSTLLSLILLPANLVLYTRWTYSPAVVESLNWTALVLELLVVLGGIVTGLFFSYTSRNDPERERIYHQRANLLGNLSGLALITLSATVSSSGEKAAVWDHGWRFYFGVALPAAIGLYIATRLATRMQLYKPERVAVAVESCYQNTGIATSVALTMFTGNDLAQAMVVPLYYGIIEAGMLGIYCITCWKRGWTKAPVNENFCVILYTTYENDCIERDDDDDNKPNNTAPNGSVEVVLGKHSETAPDQPDLVLSQGNGDNAYVLDPESAQKVQDTTESSIDAEQPTTSTELEDDEEKFTKWEKTVAIVKARAGGYRRPHQNPKARPRRGPVSLKLAVDEQVPAQDKTID